MHTILFLSTAKPWPRLRNTDRCAPFLWVPSASCTSAVGAVGGGAVVTSSSTGMRWGLGF